MDIAKCFVHPLVFLSISDHYERSGNNTTEPSKNNSSGEKEGKKIVKQDRVFGVLLGMVSGDTVDVFDSFGVPFAESTEIQNAYSYDFQNILAKFAEYKQIYKKETIVGWYSSTGYVTDSDLDIHENLIKKLINSGSISNINHFIFLSVDLTYKNPNEIPAKAYIGNFHYSNNCNDSGYRFRSIDVCVRSTEMEEAATWYLYKDVKEIDFSDISKISSDSVNALELLKNRLENIVSYMDAVINGDTQPNEQIFEIIQQISNILPTISDDYHIDCVDSKALDSEFMIFISMLANSIIALHDFVEFKHSNGQKEEKGIL